VSVQDLPCTILGGRPSGTRTWSAHDVLHLMLLMEVDGVVEVEEAGDFVVGGAAAGAEERILELRVDGVEGRLVFGLLRDHLN
jgi:hypothetical protein